MPANRTYEVKQVRRVRISATSPEEAVKYAGDVFHARPDDAPSSWPHVRSEIRDISIEAKEAH